MDGIYGTDTITLPLSWLTAVATSDLRLAVYALRGLYGATRFLHLVGMATFVGMVVILDLRGLGLFPPGALDPARRRLVVLKGSFWVTIATSVLLFLRDPLGVGLHTMFLPKLLLVVVGYVYAQGVRRLPALRRPAGRRQATSADRCSRSSCTVASSSSALGCGPGAITPGVTGLPTGFIRRAGDGCRGSLPTRAGHPS